MVNKDLEDKYRKDIIDRATFLLEQYQRLDIIYARVSTKDKGQQETDQIEPILKHYNLELDKVLLIEEKASAYKEYAQKSRRLNIIEDISKEYLEYDKTLYIWDLDRLYRGRYDMQYEYVKKMRMYNLYVFSIRQQFLEEIRNQPSEMMKMFYDVMLLMFGYFAYDESKKKADRWLKSLYKKDGRYYTNKNRLVGRKLRNLEGKKLKLTAEQLDKIENHIIKMIKHNKTYQEIIHYFGSKHNIKISLGYINNIKNKYMK